MLRFVLDPEPQLTNYYRYSPLQPYTFGITERPSYISVGSGELNRFRDTSSRLL